MKELRFFPQLRGEVRNCHLALHLIHLLFRKLATPKPASAINSDMSHVIDDATSAMHFTYDETTSMPDTTVPLSEFLDEQLARASKNEITETGDIIENDDYDSPIDMNCLLFLRVMLQMKKFLETSLLAMIERILNNC